MNRYIIDDTLFPNEQSLVLLNESVVTLSEVTTHNRIYDIDIQYNEYNTTPINTDMTFIRGDMNTSIINAKMTMHDAHIDLNGVTVTMNVKEGSYNIYTVVCENIDLVNSIVTVNMPTHLVDDVGKNVFEFILSKSGAILVSQSYSYTIIDSIGEGDIGSDVEISALQTLIQKVERLQANMMVDVTQKDIDDIMGMIK